MGGFNNSGVGLLASESEISGKEMTFSNCDLVGALAHNSQITLDDVVLQDSFFGFWAQKDDDSSTLANIHLSGIKAVNLRGVAIGAYGVDDFLISDSTIQDVAKASLPWEGGSKQDMGDGFQILNMTDNISVTNIQIDNCERSGIILDAAPDQEGLHKKIVADFTGTSIAGNGERGFVIQNGELAYDPETQTIDYGDGINPPALEDDLKDKDIIAIETGAPLLDVNSLLPLSDIMD